ncbi:MAG: signal peptidase I [Dehalococcoidia bacterium]
MTTDAWARYRPTPAPARARHLPIGAVAEWAAVAILAAVLAVVAFEPFGAVRATVIRGSSMGEAMPLGSVAISVAKDGGAIEPGDVIGFRQQTGHVVFHRVLSITGEAAGRTAVTKGDANGAADPNPVSLDGEGARVLAYVPFLGYAVMALRSPEIVAALAVAAMLAWLLADEARSLTRKLTPNRHPRWRRFPGAR